MIVQATMQLPLGPDDIITESAARGLIGKTTIAVIDKIEIGGCVVMDAEWRGPRDVELTIQIDVKDPVVAQLLLDTTRGNRK